MNRETSIGGRAGWTFLSNHALVLLAIVRDPSATLRKIAAQVGVTERAVHRIVLDLEAGRYLERIRVGRRNRYEILAGSPMRHALSEHKDVGALIEMLFGPRAGGERVSRPPARIRRRGGDFSGEGEGNDHTPGSSR
jgi:hypothetical protein